jgi:CubicO group peptidase (beta-lactamase class C family)
MKKVIFFLLFIIAGLNGIVAQVTPEKIDVIKKSVDKLAKSYNIPDFAVTIVNNDSALMTYEKNAGNAGKNYLIGSCSKSLTALAIMKLASEKIINLDAPVKKYLPWFKMKNQDYAEKVTVRNLLNHKSGFTREQGFFDRRTYTMGEYIVKLTVYFKTIDVKSAPGTVFEYSNLNYVLLGLIIRHVTGNPYADYMEQYILPWAGMTDTWLTGAENKKHNLIQPYQYSIFMVPSKSRPYFYSDYIVPAGYISSTISDAGKYLRFMLNETISDKGDTLLNPESVSIVTGKGQTGYAMGWFAYKQDSMEIINHTGLNENFSSSFDFIPKAGIGVAVLCNINSLEFCTKADQQIRSIIFTGKPVKESSFSMEKFMRQVACGLPILLLILLIFNMRKWIKNEFQVGFVPGLLPNLRLVTGVVLSLLLLFAVTSTFQMHLGKAIRFSPDIGWGLLLIAILGVSSAFAAYFGNIEK